MNETQTQTQTHTQQHAQPSARRSESAPDSLCYWADDSLAPSALEPRVYMTPGAAPDPHYKVPLPARMDVRNCGGGFAWGESGGVSGRRQLAVALIMDVTGDAEIAVLLHEVFADQVITQFHRDRWRITTAEIRQEIEALREQIRK